MPVDSQTTNRSLRKMILRRLMRRLDHGVKGDRAVWRNGFQKRLMTRYAMEQAGYPTEDRMVKVTTTFEHLTPRNLRQPTIWEALADKLGREPTQAEAADEVRRILSDCTIAQAERGALPHQRKRSASP